MTVIDITQELFSGAVYPGDKPPKLTVVQKKFSRLSEFECCAHNGTHIDAPCHFVPGGGDIESIPPEKCMGQCAVVGGKEQAALAAAKHTRIIIRGQLDTHTAKQLAGIDLIGTDDQSIGDPEVHRILLASGTVILEGLALDGIENGEYRLIALPLRLRGADGSPVRAVLLQ